METFRGFLQLPSFDFLALAITIASLQSSLPVGYMALLPVKEEPPSFDFLALATTIASLQSSLPVGYMALLPVKEKKDGV